MAKVPKKYPLEPNAERCGDSYAVSAFVTGEIEGLDFGRQFNTNITPVWFKGGTFSDPHSYPEIGLGGWEYSESDDVVRARIAAVHSDLDIANHVPLVVKNMKSLRWLLDRAEAEMDVVQAEFDDYKPALPPAEGEMIVYPESLRARVLNRFEDALRHIRCAEYWTARLALYAEAVAAYEPPPRDPSQWLAARHGELKPPLGFRAPPPGPVLPDPEGLGDPLDVPPDGAPAAQRWKTAAVLIGGAAAAFFLLPKLLK